MYLPRISLHLFLPSTPERHLSPNRDRLIPLVVLAAPLRLRLTVPLAPLLPPRLLQESSEQVAVQQGACKAEGNFGTTLSAASNPSTAEGKVDVELGEEKLEVAPLQAPLQVEIPSDTSPPIPSVAWTRPPGPRCAARPDVSHTTHDNVTGSCTETWH